MKSHTIFQSFTALSLLFAAMIANADPIRGGYADPLHIVALGDRDFREAMDGMTRARIALGGYTRTRGGPGSIDLGHGQSVEFTDANGNSPHRLRRTEENYTWWHGRANRFLGTNTSTIVIDFLDLPVVGVSFSLSAVNSRYRAWVGATAVDSHGNQVAHIDRTRWFGGLANDRAKRIGVFVADGSKACSSISQVVIDPTVTWGIGDLTYYTNPDCATVPEPGTLALLGMGLFGIGLMRRRRTAALHY